MTKKALISQADLKRMAAIAKSEGVVVSVEVDGKKFSVSPLSQQDIAIEAEPRRGLSGLDEWRARRGAPFAGSDQPAPAVSTAKGKKPREIDAEKSVNDWYAYLGYDPKTMNDADYQRLFREKEAERRKHIPAEPMTKRERSALRQLLTHGVGVSVRNELIKPCGPETEERLEARGFITFESHPQHPNSVVAYLLTDAGKAAAMKLPPEA
ncbi:hypothetical protein [Agrobacterium cavarae]|uniref:hypothetical protein n=1 Tax=Agrobacterium cavarae TaxID=2528239 RepID=UPI002898694A|nr:hypothetical protein [Agrobacterium cavarae]